MAEIKVTGKIIATPRKPAHIYRLKPAKVTEKSLRTLARQLGMKADSASGMFCSSAGKLCYTEGHLELTLDPSSGGMRLIDRSRWQIDDRKSDLDIEDTEARRLAANLIKKNKLGLASDMKFLKTARLRVGEATREGKQVSERTIDLAVAMQRQINKIPVDGPGGKIIVYLDQERNVSGIEKIWRDLGPIHRRNQAHRTPESALEEMAAYHRDNPGLIEIEEIRYGYFEDGWHATQQYLQPAYIIFGLLSSTDRNVRKRTIYVATALENPVGRITPPLKKKLRQRPRPEAR
jgi:hypothetical protein